MIVTSLRAAGICRVPGTVRVSPGSMAMENIAKTSTSARNHHAMEMRIVQMLRVHTTARVRQGIKVTENRAKISMNVK
jgi:hypothetical protein